ncbi:hypothetical protein SBOR_2917 [Sclerotinia borealis F-4128]|uniref:Amidase domain-containing protein n=1 Tax=Sclerotinia borealis (strain F-4128) TaxID=1432307 RepID=W9CKX0_SCLBF|nr:hypothetical protein SBOR_2917 [Sclerotinia borealis F-4128]
MKLDQISIAEILEGLKNGDFSSEDLVRTYIKRIEQVNATVCVVSEINQNALKIAREKDEERSRGLARGILHGVPILIKNLFFTTDGLKTTFGCTGFLEAISSIEATTIIKLREQGAIILGIANGSQWANFRFTPGWSAVGGQCLGIYHRDQHPQGSSSGSAVGTALGLCAAALGSETCGSLILPAQKSAVVGLKPTVGLTSRYGLYSASESQDTVGVLARSVKDAALVLTAIADKNDPPSIVDPRDLICSRKPIEVPDFTKACISRRLDGIRMAVPRHLFKNVDSTTMHIFTNAINTMKSLGAIIMDPASYSRFDADRSSCTGDEYDLALRIDIYHNIKKTLLHFSTNPYSLHTLSDIISYTLATPAEEASTRGYSFFASCLHAGQTYSRNSEEYLNSKAERENMGKQISKLLDKFECDMILLPTNLAMEPADVGGNPVVSVPMGYYPEGTEVIRKGNGLVDVGPGIPIGICFIGRRWDDAKLIAAAYAYEQATRWREKGKLVVRCGIELSVLGCDEKGEKN